MTAGRRPLAATFWLLEAPDSLAEQSRRNPDGYGIATYEPGDTPRVDKRPVAEPMRKGQPVIRRPLERSGVCAAA
jgi:predicted glutamine amidotransferase